MSSASARDGIKRYRLNALSSEESVKGPTCKTFSICPGNMLASEGLRLIQEKLKQPLFKSLVIVNLLVNEKKRATGHAPFDLLSVKNFLCFQELLELAFFAG